MKYEPPSFEYCQELLAMMRRGMLEEPEELPIELDHRPLPLGVVWKSREELLQDFPMKQGVCYE